ncbi:MAG TPA: AGE family epimerase/isomerase [Caulobacteraceae bacterium]|nr:AGE family epimerase/isomerase [Caulobacteraceae bacterium]
MTDANAAPSVIAAGAGAPDNVRAHAARLTRWYTESALPIWWERGADPAGGFYERLELDGAPAHLPRRLRVQARQTYVYALAARAGWSGPAQAALAHGLAAVLVGKAEDGLYGACPRSGATPDGMGLLYEQAFVLLALAAAHSRSADAALESEALQLLGRLDDFAHPLGGYAEAPGLVAPLFANPNMHLFEAFQAWTATSDNPLWRERAASLAELALDHLIDPENDALGERFGADWSRPAARADRIVWPGHLYEWAWLLMDWKDADAATLAGAVQLVELAEHTGIDAGGFAIFALDQRLAPLDRGARLWAQTERIRACARAAALTGDGALWTAAGQACIALEAFLDTPTPGLWRDWRDETGVFREEAAPASSLYHIAGAIAELSRLG